MNNFEQFKKDFKQDLLIKVIVGMRHDRVSHPAASKLAQTVLEIFQEENTLAVFKKINKLCETHPAIVDIFIKRGNEYDVRHREESIKQIHIYLKGGSPC